MKRLGPMCIVICLSGCAVFDSGPKMMAEIGAEVSKVAAAAIEQMNFTQMTANADGDVTNPELVLEGFAATGIVFKGSARLIGASLSYGIAGAGVGNAAANAPGTGGGNDGG